MFASLQHGGRYIATRDLAKVLLSDISQRALSTAHIEPDCRLSRFGVLLIQLPEELEFSFKKKPCTSKVVPKGILQQFSIPCRSVSVKFGRHVIGPGIYSSVGYCVECCKEHSLRAPTNTTGYLLGNFR